MLERSTGLSTAQLDGIARLEVATVAHDGGRLKLEWGALASRATDQVNDVLWLEDGAVVGFAGLYGFASTTVEVAGMVDPAHRRRGIGGALLDEALRLSTERGYKRFLLVTPRHSGDAARLAIARGGTLEHSEHALVLAGDVTEGSADPTMTLRPAAQDDVEAIRRILVAAFGKPFEPPDPLAPGEPTLVAERDGAVVASMRVHKGTDGWGIYGFGVLPELQGKGIGRDLLRRVCREARDQGVARVHLEVAVDNDRALGLYTSVGFVHEATEDYYEIPLAA